MSSKVNIVFIKRSKENAELPLWVKCEDDLYMVANKPEWNVKLEVYENVFFLIGTDGFCLDEEFGSLQELLGDDQLEIVDVDIAVK